MSRVLVVTWAPGGNLPPLLAAGTLLAARGHTVAVLASAATEDAARNAGLVTRAYRRAADPDTTIAFEQQADTMMGAAAGAAIALDVADAAAEHGAHLAVVDCMLPAGLAGAAAARVRTASLVHFPYGLARQSIAAGHGWTTDLARLAATRRELGLPPARDALDAWERHDVVLVTAPRWFDADAAFPPQVVHAGPLGVRHTNAQGAAGAPRVLISFSTTVMEGQQRLIERTCEAVAGSSVTATLTRGSAADAEAARVPEGVAVERWVDHDALLPGAAAVVGHGGLGTTLRALAHGVPLLLMPLGRDQEFNARQVARLGAGIHLPPTAPAVEIQAALQRLLECDGFPTAARALARRIAADEPDRRAADALAPASHREAVL